MMYKAIITGASSGIGQAIYKALKQDPSFIEVIGISRTGPDLKIDLSKPLPKQPIAKKVNLLINCAGVMPFNETTNVMDTNFWGTYNLIRNLKLSFPVGSCIINIASVSGMMAEPEFPVYAASKAAIISLTKSLAKKFAPVVRVNCISPGFYKTNLVEGETPQELIDKIPLRFEEEPESIVPIIKMIWEAKYMTGTNIVIDGGISIC